MISYGVTHLVNLPHPHFFCYQQVGRQGIFLESLNSFTLHDSNIKMNHLLDCVCISKNRVGANRSAGDCLSSHTAEHFKCKRTAVSCHPVGKSVSVFTNSRCLLRRARGAGEQNSPEGNYKRKVFREKRDIRRLRR